MTSREIYEFLEKNEVAKLYKKFESCFALIDKWSDIFIKGDLLSENELALAMDQSTGVFAKLCPITNALESYMERLLYNTEAKFYQAQEKVKTQDTSVGKATARSAVSDVRDYLSDFKSYLTAAQQNITTSQSRLKRLVVIGAAKKVGHYGEVPVEETVTSDDLIEDEKKNNISWGE